MPRTWAEENKKWARAYILSCSSFGGQLESLDGPPQALEGTKYLFQLALGVWQGMAHLISATKMGSSVGVLSNGHY